MTPGCPLSRNINCPDLDAEHLIIFLRFFFGIVSTEGTLRHVPRTIARIELFCILEYVSGGNHLSSHFHYAYQSKPINSSQVFPPIPLLPRSPHKCGASAGLIPPVIFHDSCQGVQITRQMHAFSGNSAKAYPR